MQCTGYGSSWGHNCSHSLISHLSSIPRNRRRRDQEVRGRRREEGRRRREGYFKSLGLCRSTPPYGGYPSHTQPPLPLLLLLLPTGEESTMIQPPNFSSFSLVIRTSHAGI